MEDEEDDEFEEEEEEFVTVGGQPVRLSEVTDEHTHRMTREEYQDYAAKIS